MKTSALILSVVVIGAMSGIGGAFAYSDISGHLNSPSSTNTLAIANFSLSSSEIEQSSFGFLSFDLKATSPGDGGYQVYILNSTSNLTIASGSFFDKLSYVDTSLGSGFLLGALPAGSYTFGALVFQGGNEVSMVRDLTVIPSLIFEGTTGPNNVSDASGNQLASYSVLEMNGGQQPYYYNWSVSSYYFGNVQNFTPYNNTSLVFTVEFYKNPSTGFNIGENATYYINLKITDALGYSVSTSYPGFEVNVTGD